MNPVKTAVIGCGVISDIYLTNLSEKYTGISLLGCSANHLENARKKAQKYGILAYENTDALLQDPEVELVLILTPAPTHFELIQKALLAGKHVYTEKPLATTTEEASVLLGLAREKGLLLGCAPETFLGSAFQSARSFLDAGSLGEITSFHVVANRDVTFLASIFPFLRMPYGGVGYDYAVYYLTALIHLLGPMKSVFAQVSNTKTERINCFQDSPDYGKPYRYENESQIHALCTTEAGIPGTFSINGDSAFQDLAYFTIQGTGGVLKLVDANGFGGDVLFYSNEPGGSTPQVLSPASPLSFNARGIGPADMARCLRKGGTPLVDASLAAHVLDIVESMNKSSASQELVQIATTCERPRAFSDYPELLQ